MPIVNSHEVAVAHSRGREPAHARGYVLAPHSRLIRTTPKKIKCLANYYSCDNLVTTDVVTGGT